MPKLKTHRGAAKRVKRTASGKFKRHRAYHSHILSKKTTKRKRRLRAPVMASDPDNKILARMLVASK